METAKQANQVYKYFWLSVSLKGVISALEIIAGIAALLTPRSVVESLVSYLTHGPLALYPHNFLVVETLHILQSFSASLQFFIAIYLLSRGLIKLFLVIALLKNKLWAYPVSLVVLGLFVVYQAYQIVREHSPIVVLITVFDLIVIYFIWREYQEVKAGAVPRPLSV